MWRFQRFFECVVELFEWHWPKLLSGVAFSSEPKTNNSRDSSLEFRSSGWVVVARRGSPFFRLFLSLARCVQFVASRSPVSVWMLIIIIQNKLANLYRYIYKQYLSGGFNGRRRVWSVVFRSCRRFKSSPGWTF